MDEDAFLRKLLENPADDVVRLVYADWLEERETDDARQKAEFLRASVQLLTGELTKLERKEVRTRQFLIAAGFDAEWLRIVSRTQVENCGDRQYPWQEKCYKRWDEMIATERIEVRYCLSCQESVYYCDTIAQARDHYRQRHCIALDHRLTRREGDVKPSYEEYLMMDSLLESQSESGESPTLE